jgi:hypothetical protein
MEGYFFSKKIPPKPNSIANGYIQLPDGSERHPVRVDYAEKDIAQIQLVQLIFHLQKADAFMTQDSADKYIFSF